MLRYCFCWHNQDPYDNALIAAVNGLYKQKWFTIKNREGAQLIDVELATLNWVDWFNHRRFLSSISYVQPAEFEMAYYRKLEESAKVAWFKINCFRNTLYGSNVFFNNVTELLCEVK